MMRGGVFSLAAPLFVGLLAPIGARAQAPIRIRDASFAVVRNDGVPAAGALTLYDAVIIASERATRAGFGVLSAFADGRISMQGGLEFARRSSPIAVPAPWHGWFTALRGEMLLEAATTIQTGFMPTAAITGRARVRFEHESQGGHADAAVARAFDGRFWQTVLIGEGRAWLRRGDVVAGVRTTAMQLGVGDLLADHEVQFEWLAGRRIVAGSLGTRLGEALRGTTGWGTFSLTMPVFVNTSATVSVGRYPADLVQNLPAGAYASLGLRLPNGRFPMVRPPPRRPPPPPERTPELPVSFRLALVTGPALDSTGIREVRVWAPGARVVEIMADFVDWIPVPLVRQPGGEWRGYYRIAPGLHRVNLRIDGEELDAPQNWPRQQDEFVGAVAIVFVR